MRIEGFSPREIAHEVALASLRDAYVEVTRHRRYNGKNLAPTESRAVGTQLAKLHDRLLEKSGLDGVGLGEGLGD